MKVSDLLRVPFLTSQTSRNFRIHNRVCFMGPTGLNFGSAHARLAWPTHLKKTSQFSIAQHYSMLYDSLSTEKTYDLVLTLINTKGWD